MQISHQSVCYCIINFKPSSKLDPRLSSKRDRLQTYACIASRSRSKLVQLIFAHPVRNASTNRTNYLYVHVHSCNAGPKTATGTSCRDFGASFQKFKENLRARVILSSACPVRKGGGVDVASYIPGPARGTCMQIGPPPRLQVCSCYILISFFVEQLRNILF